MVCIAAFIILAVLGIFAAFISIFKRDFGKKYWKIFKKAWGCVGKKVRLQKCETGFKDDVKNTILSRVIIKHPKWVKPLEIIMEVVSVLIVAITIWSLVIAIKSLLALWTLGTCNVTKPAVCSLGAEVCSIDEKEPSNIIEATGRWFEEWGEIFAAIPDKFRDYSAENFDLVTVSVTEAKEDKKTAIDIIDPGCSVCMRSYINQKESGFFENYNLKLVIFPIQGPDDSFKFQNSELIARVAYAADTKKEGLAAKIIDHIFSDRNEEGINFQTLFNDYYDNEKAIEELKNILAKEGISEADQAEIFKNAYTEEITNILIHNRDVVEHNLHAKGIPTMLYDGQKHTGLYKKES